MTYQAAIAALADPTRRAIYEGLRGAPRAVGDLARDVPVSRPAVSQHLRVLRDADLVTETRVGTRHVFAANPAAALELRDYFHSMWQCALQSYARHVEREEQRHARRTRRR
jgi:DNA-binding transcriptional ArsR family regulator